MKPIIPTEGVAVGALIPAPDYEDIDPSTGQCISVIKTGRYDSEENEGFDGRIKPLKLGSTPPLKTPVVP